MHTPWGQGFLSVWLIILFPAGQQCLALIEAQWVSVLGRTAWCDGNRRRVGVEPLQQRNCSKSGERVMGESVSQRWGDNVHSLFYNMNWGAYARCKGEGRGIPWGRGSQHLSAWHVPSHSQEWGPLGIMEASAWALRWDWARWVWQKCDWNRVEYNTKKWWAWGMSVTEKVQRLENSHLQDVYIR